MDRSVRFAGAALALLLATSAAAPTVAQQRHAAQASAQPSTRVTAQPSARQRADELFYAGRALVVRGQYAEACPKFEQAQALRSGIGTLLNLGDCYERLGRFASASSAFTRAAAMAQEAEDARAEIANSRIHLLESKVRHLTVSVDSDLDQMVILLNGVPLEREHWGQAEPRDPGKYALEVSAPGMQSWRTEVIVDDIDQVLHVPPLRPLGAVPAPKPPPTAEAHARATADPSRAAPNPRGALALNQGPDASPAWNLGQVSALALGGAGVIGAAVGAVFGLRSMRRGDEVDEHCVLGPDRDLCPADSHYDDLSKQAVADGERANAAFALAGLALVGGAVLWLSDAGAPTPKQSPDVGVALRPDWASVQASVVGCW